MNKGRRFLKILIISILIILSLTCVFFPLYKYWDKFYENGLSENPEDWAQFGDYIGGTTNVIIGILNIVATIILAFVIKNLDDKRTNDKEKEDNKRHKELIDIENLRHKQSLELQKDLFYKNIQFSRYESYNSMFLELTDVITKEADLFIVSERVTHFNIKIISFFNSNKNLFPFITKELIETHRYLFQEVIKLYTAAFNDIRNQRNNSELLRHSSTKNLLTLLEQTNNKFDEYLINDNKKSEI